MGVVGGAASGAAAGSGGGIPGAVAGAAIGAVASIFGNKKQASASKYATQAQTRAADEALAYQKEQDAYNRKVSEDERAYQRSQDALTRQLALEARDYSRGQYADYLGRLRPYAGVGERAVTGLERQLGGTVAATVPSMARGGGMVTLKSPSGSVRQVPAAQAAHYMSLGAQRVE